MDGPNDAPYIGEMRIFSFQQAPKGWARCDGQLLQISQNQALFSLIGTTYGGNGSTTFALPNLQARVPLHAGGGFTLGEAGGAPSTTLTTGQLPKHSHFLVGNNVTAAGGIPYPSSRLANSEPGNLYGPTNNLAAMNAQAIGNTGGSQPHENRQPYLGLTVCIALVGEFPSRN